MTTNTSEVRLRDDLLTETAASLQVAGLVAMTTRAAVGVLAISVSVENPELAADLSSANRIVSIVNHFVDLVGSISLGKSTSFNPKDPVQLSKDILSFLSVIWTITSIVNKIFHQVRGTPLFQLPVLNLIFGGVTIAASAIDIYLNTKDLVALSGKLSQAMGGKTILGDHTAEINKEVAKLDDSKDKGKAKQLLEDAWKGYDLKTQKPEYLRKQMMAKSVKIVLSVMIIALTVLSLVALFAVGGPAAAFGIAVAIAVIQGSALSLGITSYAMKLFWPEAKKPTIKSISVEDMLMA